MPTVTHSAPSGSLHPLTKLAFYDELEKIASDVRPDAKKRRGELARFLKGTAAISAGTATGTGAFMLADRAAHAIGSKAWAKLSPRTRYTILAPAAALSGAGAAVLTKKLFEEKRKYTEGR